MEDKIAEKLERVGQELATVEKKMLEYQQNVIDYQPPRGLDDWQVIAALNLTAGHYQQLEDRRTALLEEKQELENRLASSYLSIEEEILIFQERHAHHMIPHPLNPSQLNGALKWVENSFQGLHEKKRVRLGEKQELEKDPEYRMRLRSLW
ncbi:hypothetical protein ACH5RR_036256 [Cinchona calisaya]|uniref:Uncharacterized protein n=1 Tax=Cinchona calisaya TaxID=153742 RepID=A0ABD2Y2P2_9GENT